MAIAKKQYEFTEDRWFLNAFYKKGAREWFYPKQVELDGHSLVEVTATVAAAPAKAKPDAKAS